MSRQSFFSGVGFRATDHLATMNRVVGVNPGMSLEMLLSGEGFVAIRTIVNPLYLLATIVPLYHLSIDDISLLYKGWLL